MGELLGYFYLGEVLIAAIGAAAITAVVMLARPRPAPAASTDSDSAGILGTPAVLILPVVALALLASLMGFFDTPGGVGTISKFEERLPVLMVGGVLVLLLALVATAKVFSTLKLVDQTEALGLPRGSVRAVIALSLILIFAIMSIFLYVRTATPSLTILEGLTQAQVDQIPARELRRVTPVSARPAPARSPAATAETSPGASPTATPPERFTVQRVASDEVSNDIAKQLLTTISTLVVAIAAFYFGTSSVLAAKDDTGRRQLFVTGPEPRRKRSMEGGKWSPVRLTVRTIPEGLQVITRIFGDANGTVTPLGKSEFEYQPVQPTESVLVRFELSIDPDVTGAYEVAFALGEKVVGEKVVGEKVVGEKVVGEKGVGEKVVGEKGEGGEGEGGEGEGGEGEGGEGEGGEPKTLI